MGDIRKERMIIRGTTWTQRNPGMDEELVAVRG